MDYAYTTRPFWQYFFSLSRIPRASKKEEAIRAFIIEQATRHSLESKVDSYGNVVVIVPSTINRSLPTLALQAHMDMVCEKEPGSLHDFDKDPIPVYEYQQEGISMLTAKGTSLGADNGIGLAYILALFDSAHRPKHHPRLELVCSVEEEIGLVGAMNFDSHLLHATQLINLDNTEKNTICIGCAGALISRVCIGFDKASPNNENDDEANKKNGNKNTWCIAELVLSGLAGGHSGMDIWRGRTNALLCMSELLLYLTDLCDCKLLSFEGGDKMNAIPRDACARVLINKDSVDILSEAIHTFASAQVDNALPEDKTLTITHNQHVVDTEVSYAVSTKDIVSALTLLPSKIHHAQRLSFEGVQSSSSLSSASMSEKGIELLIFNRFNSQVFHDHIADMLKSYARRFTRTKHTSVWVEELVFDHYVPAWEAVPHSPLFNRAQGMYKKHGIVDARGVTVHAGVEGGVFVNRCSDLNEAISIGPDIYDLHSPQERVNKNSADKIWDILFDLIDATNM